MPYLTTTIKNKYTIQTAGTEVTIIATHDNVVIVKNVKGERFCVMVDEITYNLNT